MTLAITVPLLVVSWAKLSMSINHFHFQVQLIYSYIYIYFFLNSFRKTFSAYWISTSYCTSDKRVVMRKLWRTSISALTLGANGGCSELMLTSTQTSLNHCCRPTNSREFPFLALKCAGLYTMNTSFM